MDMLFRYRPYNETSDSDSDYSDAIKSKSHCANLVSVFLFFFLSVLSFAVHNLTSAGHSLTCPRLPPPQIKEELAAAEARRPALIVAQPALRLDLPAALQQPPPRLDMCSVCAGRFQKVGHWGAGGAELGRWTAWIRFAVRLDSMACAC